MLIWSIRVSLLLLWAVLMLQSFGFSPVSRHARVGWMIGAILALIHAWIAMGWVHHWSIADAYRVTGEETKQLIGVSVGAGLFVNFAFVAIWLWDATFRVVHPTRYVKAANKLRRSVELFLLFIAVQGAIVFETGATRWIGLVCLLAYVVALIHAQSRNRRYRNIE